MGSTPDSHSTLLTHVGRILPSYLISALVRASPKMGSGFFDFFLMFFRSCYQLLQDNWNSGVTILHFYCLSDPESLLERPFYYSTGFGILASNITLKTFHLHTATKILFSSISQSNGLPHLRLLASSLIESQTL